MSVNVIMPQLGESIYEGTVTKWLKKVGDKVNRDEPLFEVSTDKVDTEIPSPAAGVLEQISVKEGQTVKINTVVAVIADKVVAPVEVPRPKAQPMKAATPKPVAIPAAPAPATPADRRIFSSPLVRRIAREKGIDLGKLSGTGLHQRITKNDILAYLDRDTVAAPPSIPGAPASSIGGVEILPMSQMRRKIAEHMVMSKHTSPHVTTVFEVDLSKVVDLYEREKGHFSSALGIKLTYTHFIARAIADALKEFPIVNSSIEGDKILIKHFVNLGIAVAIPEGLIVPVVKHVEEKSFLGLAKGINDVAERARSKRLNPDDVQDGTFTITNPGIYGGLFGTPIISQPQAAILGIGAIKKRAVVINDAIAIRPMVYLALSFDHRILDGAVADQFMARLKEILETWSQSIR